MLFVFETHGPLCGDATEEVFTAVHLAQARESGATLILMQEGVLHALQTQSGVDALLAAGVRVLADRFSLALRGIKEEKLPASITAVDMPTIIELLTACGVRPVWH
jgi:sulfur relay protein TusB/DsrH